MTIFTEKDFTNLLDEIYSELHLRHTDYYCGEITEAEYELLTEDLEFMAEELYNYMYPELAI